MLESPQSFRLRELPQLAFTAFSSRDFLSQTSPDNQYPVALSGSNPTMPPHSSHPDFLNLTNLVSQAVLEVVIVALPGFVVAVSGMFDAKSQKMVSELNNMIFTPCLIFTKLAGQLNADKLAELFIIPLIFVTQTLISWLCAQAMSRAFGFHGEGKKRQRNFILAMGVFGNSNSLPMSLIISLSKTISGLHWDRVPGDNDDEVAARGILYLLIFQQLGQMLRWTWGFNVLLKPASEYEEDERLEGAEENRSIEEGRYSDHPEHDTPNKSSKSGRDSGFSSGAQTPEPPARQSQTFETVPATPATGTNGDNISSDTRNLIEYDSNSDSSSERPTSSDQITVFPSFSRSVSHRSGPAADAETGWKAPLYRVRNSTTRMVRRVCETSKIFFHNRFRSLPEPLQKVLGTCHYHVSKFCVAVWKSMNPPLWAMLVALLVASIPDLQHTFFTKGTFVNNSITRAISQTGGVAVPLILVVLGANLARSTIPKEQLAASPEDKKEERRLLFASLLSRMVLPVIVMAPLLALTTKYVPVSILDDPIFIIVCFLLTGAPSALQLAQICQLNDVFMGAMSALLFASYVVVIFPSTLILVMLALEVLEWTV